LVFCIIIFPHSSFQKLPDAHDAEELITEYCNEFEKAKTELLQLIPTLQSPFLCFTDKGREVIRSHLSRLHDQNDKTQHSLNRICRIGSGDLSHRRVETEDRKRKKRGRTSLQSESALNWSLGATKKEGEDETDNFPILDNRDRQLTSLPLLRWKKRESAKDTETIKKEKKSKRKEKREKRFRFDVKDNELEQTRIRMQSEGDVGRSEIIKRAADSSPLFHVNSEKANENQKIESDEEGCTYFYDEGDDISRSSFYENEWREEDSVEMESVVMPVLDKLRHCQSVFDGGNIMISLVGIGQKSHSPFLARILTVFLSDFQKIVNSAEMRMVREIITNRNGDGLLDMLYRIEEGAKRKYSLLQLDELVNSTLEMEVGWGEGLDLDCICNEMRVEDVEESRSRREKHQKEKTQKEKTKTEMRFFTMSPLICDLPHSHSYANLKRSISKKFIGNLFFPSDNLGFLVKKYHRSTHLIAYLPPVEKNDITINDFFRFPPSSARGVYLKVILFLIILYYIALSPPHHTTSHHITPHHTTLITLEQYFPDHFHHIVMEEQLALCVAPDIITPHEICRVCYLTHFLCFYSLTLFSFLFPQVINPPNNFIASASLEVYGPPLR
jgi:hypothetical protein